MVSFWQLLELKYEMKVQIAVFKGIVLCVWANYFLFKNKKIFAALSPMEHVFGENFKYKPYNLGEWCFKKPIGNSFRESLLFPFHLIEAHVTSAISYPVLLFCLIFFKHDLILDSIIRLMRPFLNNFMNLLK